MVTFYKLYIKQTSLKLEKQIICDNSHLRNSHRPSPLDQSVSNGNFQCVPLCHLRRFLPQNFAI